LSGVVWWLMPVIPATWEVDIESTAVQDQPRQKVVKTPSGGRGEK
jgi:hypothetical protein